MGERPLLQSLFLFGSGHAVRGNATSRHRISERQNRTSGHKTSIYYAFLTKAALLPVVYDFRRNRYH